jgi:LacI family transcriptional regulator
MDNEVSAKLTQKDIARKAGVSTSAVSMVMRGKGNISNKIRSKIMKIAEEGGYKKPALKEQEQGVSRYIMVVEWESFEYQWNFIKPFMVNLSDSLIHDNFYPIFYHIEKKRPAEVLEQAIISSNCSGICSIHYFNKTLFSRLEKAGISVVLLNNNIFQNDFSAVCVDDFQGVYNGVSYLVEKGHKNILYFDYIRPDLEACVTDRYFGFRKAAEEYSIRSHERITLVLENKQELYQTLHTTLEENPDTTAIVFHDDYLAAWGIPELERMGLKIPEDISVIAPGDTLNFNEPFTPQFTTIQIDTGTMGKLASQLIEEKIRNAQSEVKHLKVTPVIVERGSCRDLI